MTAPIGFRTVHPPAHGSTVRPPVVPALPLPDPIDVTKELFPAGSRPIPKDHLELIRALIEAGKFSRALELLDSAWRLDAEHEHAWYFRLWATIGEGNPGAALDLARSITPRLPGSAAIAYLQAHLEEHAGDVKVALEAALRASAAAPERAESTALVRRLVALVAEQASARAAQAEAPGNLSQPGVLSLLGAALQGAALLHPSGSTQSHRTVMPPRIPQPDPGTTGKSPLGKRFGLVALATVIAALWAVPDPVPAAIMLAIVVVLVTRSMGSPARRN